MEDKCDQSSEMSSKETENTLKSKLMEILEEEILALKLSETKKGDKSEYLKGDLQDESEIVAVDERKAFSSLGEKTAEALSGNDHQNEIKCNPEDLNSPPDNVSGGEVSRQTSYQHQEIEYTQREESPNPVSEKEVGKMSQPMRNDDQKSSKYDMESFVLPPDSLLEKILQRIEFYFQDYNIFKNSFLLNHIRRNKKGYVSLKIVASLRKIRALTKDLRVVIHCLKKSNVLELNPECNKIRRIEPIPKIEDTSFGKTVMVFNLPHQNLTTDYLRELFSKFGTVVSVGVFDMNSPDRNVYHDRCLYFHRKIASIIYGLVEFEKYGESVKALKDEDGYLPKENEMKVVPLMPQIYKKEKRHLKFLEQSHAYPRGGYRRFKPRNEPRTGHNEMPVASGDGLRNGKINMGGYQYNRGNFRRPYRGRRAFVPPVGKQYSDGHISGDYNGIKNNKWSESRQLKANNSFNIDHAYPNMYRKKTENGYIQNGVSI